MKSPELVTQCVEKVGSHFLLCNLLSQRLKQLTDGAPPRVSPVAGLSKTEIALQEILQGLIHFERIKEE